MSDDFLPFPLLAIVGQAELKTALILGLINPLIGGVLLIGPYGVGKTTAVRSLLDIMPVVEDEEEDQSGKRQQVQRSMRLVELPLNARIEDVVGGLNERVAVEQYRMLLEEGILARAHKNLLYVDEVNLLDSHIVDVILDAAAQGQTLVRRGAMARLFPSQFVLIGSMNPEEGTLRPQIMDRFGLRVWVAPVTDSLQRLEIYRRSQAFRSDPVSFRASYTEGTLALREEISTAREILPHVVIPSSVEIMAMTIIQKLQIPSHRAEITLLEAARARAASDFRTTVTIEDVVRMAPLALRQRRSSVLESYAAQLDRENATIESVMQSAADAVSQEDSRSERESVVRKIERED
jgi:magnesium chelatase subunit I